jgi:hypothetical protein
MSKYFEEVEFTVPAVEEKVEKVDPTFNQEKLAVALAAVKDEIERLERGTSAYLSHGIHFGPYGCPAQNSLKTFENDPSWTNFQMFIRLAKQDFSARPATAMNKMLLEAVEK